MFGGFGGLPKGSKGSEKDKLGVIKVPTPLPQSKPGSTLGNIVPDATVRVKPTVAGPGVGVGKVDFKVEPMVAGRRDLRQDVNAAKTMLGYGSVYGHWKSREDFEGAKKEKRVGIRWVGPIFDDSGYGEACRNYVAALSRSGFPISSRSVSLGPAVNDSGLPGRTALRTLNIGHSCAINLVYTPPQFFKTHRDPKAYNIGMFVWEMNGLPGEWVGACNSMNEIWVPCEWNAKAARDSGVKVPVYVFGHTVAPEEYENVQALNIPNLDPSWYKFYSIFQWSSRKNPDGLLRAYLRAFTSKDPVVLILKTYGQTHSTDEEKKVRAEIDAIRKEVGGSQPRVLLITKILSRAQILGLHKLGDCFFLPHRAEGWGLPHFEACMSGKPVITTNYGGNLEFTKPKHSYLVNYKLAPVSGMDWFKWFTPDMTWAEADSGALVDALRHVYEYKVEAAEKGLMAKDYVTKNFNWSTIGEAMKRRISEIVKIL